MRVCSASPRVRPRAACCVRASERLSLLCCPVGLNPDFFLPRGGRQNQVGRFLHRNAIEAVFLGSHGRTTHCISPELESPWSTSTSTRARASIGDDAFSLDPRTLVGHSDTCRRLNLDVDEEDPRSRKRTQASPRSGLHPRLYTRIAALSNATATGHSLW